MDEKLTALQKNSSIYFTDFKFQGRIFWREKLDLPVASLYTGLEHYFFCGSNQMLPPIFSLEGRQNTMSEQRCFWASHSPLEIAYHDLEWGVPTHDDRRLFEFLVLESAQAGLSWLTILKKRDGYRRAFADFAVEEVARFDDAAYQALLLNPEIVRNKQKIAATLQNARAFLRVQEQFGSFDAFLWRFVDGVPRKNSWASRAEIPTHTRESDQLSKELKRLGFTFVGTIICYSFMQAIGMVNDHTTDCFRWEAIKEKEHVTKD